MKRKVVDCIVRLSEDDWSYVSKNRHRLGVSRVELDCVRRWRSPPIILEFWIRCTTMRQCARHIYYPVTWLCIPWECLWNMGLKYWMQNNHRWVYVCYDQIHLEAKNYMKHTMLLVSRTIFVMERFHKNHCSSHQTQLPSCKGVWFFIGVFLIPSSSSTLSVSRKVKLQDSRP